MSAIAQPAGDFRWRSPVANAAALPGSNNLDGDVREALDTKIIWIWDTGSSSWKSVGGGVSSPVVVSGAGIVTVTGSGGNTAVGWGMSTNAAGTVFSLGPNPDPSTGWFFQRNAAGNLFFGGNISLQNAFHFSGVTQYIDSTGGDTSYFLKDWGTKAADFQLDITWGNHHKVTLGGNITLDWNGARNGNRYMVHVLTGTGGWTLSWGSTVPVTWKIAGDASMRSTTAGDASLFEFWATPDGSAFYGRRVD